MQVNLVMTLIAGPGGSDALLEVIGALGRALPLSVPPDWLAHGVACDMALAAADAKAAEEVARDAIGDRPIDVLVQPLTGRRKRVLVADLESTLIENEMLEELAEFVGLRTAVAGITR